MILAIAALGAALGASPSIPNTPQQVQMKPVRAVPLPPLTAPHARLAQLHCLFLPDLWGLALVNVPQVHIALGMDPTSMSVEWTTMAKVVGPSTVIWGSPTGQRNATARSSHFFAQGSFYLHTAVMTGLTSGQRYGYKVCSGDVCSEGFNFTAAVEPGQGGKTGPSVHVLFGE